MLFAPAVAACRFTRLWTTPPTGEDPDKLLELAYIHDPVGNIVSICDAALDVLYRLIFAQSCKKLEYGATSHGDPPPAASRSAPSWSSSTPGRRTLRWTAPEPHEVAVGACYL